MTCLRVCFVATCCSFRVLAAGAAELEDGVSADDDMVHWEDVGGSFGVGLGVRPADTPGRRRGPVLMGDEWGEYCAE